MLGTAYDTLAALAATQCSTFSSAQARSVGMTRAEVRSLVRIGVCRSDGNGLFSFTNAPQDWRQKLWLAQLDAGHDAAIGKWAAIQLHGLVRRRGAVEVVALRGDRHRIRQGGLSETLWLPPQHVTTVEGLRVTTIARSIFDIAGTPPIRGTLLHEGLRAAHARTVNRLINRAMSHYGVGINEFLRVTVSVGHRGVPGTSIMKELVGRILSDPKFRPSESDLEMAFVELLESAGVPVPEAQVDISDHMGWIGRVDFLDRRRNRVFEIDGPTHETPLQREMDEKRDRRLTAMGLEVVRIREGQLLNQPSKVLAVVTSDEPAALLVAR